MVEMSAIWRKFRTPSLAFFLVIITAFSGSSSNASEIVVETKQGKLSGSVLKSRNGLEYFAFKGIPYGRIVQRFEPAIPHPSWDETRDAKEFGPVCPQFEWSSQTVVGEEGCLFVNVYTPTISEDAKLSVVVFVHGGGFQFGSSNDMGGKYFVDENVVLVTMNYRLAALGFLSTGDSVIQGNIGLKDQNLALKWVQSYIHSFGGDKDKVLLMGTSAGAASVSFQLLSPMSAGLFHRAEVTSGSALNPWSLSRNPGREAKELAEHLDCPTEPSEALKACLQNTDFRKIVQIRVAKWYLDPVCPFVPVIEKPREGQDKSELFLTEEPLTLLQEGRFNRVPIVSGLMEDEGLLFHAAPISKNPELQRNMNEDWNSVAPITFVYDFRPFLSFDEVSQLSRTIRGFYFGGRTIDSSSLQNLTNIYSDRYFNYGVKKASLLQAKFTPVYPFILGFHGDWSILNLYFGDAFKKPLGVSHGDDMHYLFDGPKWKGLKEADSLEFSKRFVKTIASFAKTGNMMDTVQTFNAPWLPIGPDEVKKNRVKWYYLDLKPRTLQTEKFKERMDFWEKIESQLNSMLAKKVGESEGKVEL